MSGLTTLRAGDPTGTDLPPGTRWGPFELLRLLGRGGMGTVYEAHDRLLDRRVAVKLLSPRVAARGEAQVEHLLREARAVARLDHPNVVTVHQVGRHAGTYFIAMQLVRGQSASARLGAEGALPPGEAARVVLDTARGLAAAHELGIVHRDVKPDNILLGEDGAVKVADFGLARQRPPAPGATGSGAVVGTPHYMSPEQAQGFAVDARSDIYSLGATWYCLLAGRPPFAGESALEVLFQQAAAEPPDLATIRPDVPAAHLRLIRRALAKRPADRFQSAAELVAELERMAAEAEAIRVRRARRLRRGMAAAAVVLAGVAGAGAARHFWLRPAPAPTDPGIIVLVQENNPDVPGDSVGDGPAESEAPEAAAPEADALPAAALAPALPPAAGGPPAAPTAAGKQGGGPEAPAVVGVVVRRRERPIVEEVKEPERPAAKTGRDGSAGGKGRHAQQPTRGRRGRGRQ